MHLFRMLTRVSPIPKPPCLFNKKQVVLLFSGLGMTSKEDLRYYYISSAEWRLNMQTYGSIDLLIFPSKYAN